MIIIGNLGNEQKEENKNPSEIIIVNIFLDLVQVSGLCIKFFTQNMTMHTVLYKFSTLTICMVILLLCQLMFFDVL